MQLIDRSSKMKLQDYSNEDLIAEMARRGLEVRKPHPATEYRRRLREQRVFPVIARSGRTYIQPNGRRYGETSPAEQRQADAGWWRAGAEVRDQCEPMTVSVAGAVARIYAVNGWRKDGAKWLADLGPELSDADLDATYPDYPYRRGDSCPTRKGGAYRPETY